MSLTRATVAAAAAAVIGGLLAGAPAPAPAAESSDSVHALFLDFNGGKSSTPNLTSSGWATVTTEIASVNGGTVGRARHGGARGAARFEPFDDEAPPEFAVLVVRPGGDQDPFAPRRKRFTFGAAFRLDEVSRGSDYDNGNNLVQRGLHTDEAQYKLQVDDGRLSCHVRGAAGSVLVVAKLRVRPERWYWGGCTRHGRSVTLRLVERTPDGAIRHRWTRSNAIGRLTFAEGAPLSIGGKVTHSGEVVEGSSDQFNGRVDNVFFRLLDQ